MQPHLTQTTALCCSPTLQPRRGQLDLDLKTSGPNFNTTKRRHNTPGTGRSIITARWYVSVVSNFPNTFALVLDSNLHDLNGTNPDWRCFQQNCHDVVLCAENKSSRNDLKLHGCQVKNNTKILAKDEDQGAHTLSTRVGGAPLGRSPILITHKYRGSQQFSISKSVEPNEELKVEQVFP